MRPRAVEGIALSLFSDSEHRYLMVEVLAQTSTPVWRLIIPVRRHVGAKRTLPTARTHLSHVEALHTVALVQPHNLVCVFLPSLLYHSSGYIRAGWRGQATLQRCWRPYRCLKRSSAYGFLRSWLVACRVKLDGDATFAER